MKIITASGQVVPEINYPDVVGWEWTGEGWTDDLDVHHEGLLHSLTWDRHIFGFTYSSKRASDGRWVNIRCEGDYWEDKNTLKLARELAQDFILLGTTSDGES